MAATKVPLGSTLRLIVQTGTDEEGNPVLKSRNYRNVKPTAADQDLFDIASTLAALQKHTLNGVQRVDEANLINQ